MLSTFFYIQLTQTHSFSIPMILRQCNVIRLNVTYLFKITYGVCVLYIY